MMTRDIAADQIAASIACLRSARAGLACGAPHDELSFKARIDLCDEIINRVGAIDRDLRQLVSDARMAGASSSGCNSDQDRTIASRMVAVDRGQDRSQGNSGQHVTGISRRASSYRSWPHRETRSAAASRDIAFRDAVLREIALRDERRSEGVIPKGPCRTSVGESARDDGSDQVSG